MRKGNGKGENDDSSSSSASSVENEEESVVQVSIDNIITPDSSKEFDVLDFKTGLQLNVPTLRFLGHLLETSEELANELESKEKKEEQEWFDARSEESDTITNGGSGDSNSVPTTTKMTKKDMKLKKKLKKLGFSADVFDSIKIIQSYFHTITKNTAKISKWIAGVADNVWNILFTGGNNVEVLLKGGVGIKKDKHNNNG